MVDRCYSTTPVHRPTWSIRLHETTTDEGASVECRARVSTPCWRNTGTGNLKSRPHPVSAPASLVNVQRTSLNLHRSASPSPFNPAHPPRLHPSLLPGDSGGNRERVSAGEAVLCRGREKERQAAEGGRGGGVLTLIYYRRETHRSPVRMNSHRRLASRSISSPLSAL
jgi:hypothetical protein